jgi:rhodanese-related sulfurtransferase
MPPFRLLVLALGLLGFVAGCGSAAEADRSLGGAGVRTIDPTVGAALAENPPADLVILDVRTPEEFSEVHLEGATLLNIYDADFADQLATLDPEAPYLIYCRSGNRSGQAAAMMEDLGFRDVSNVDGGILAWMDQGLPTIGR